MAAVALALGVALGACGSITRVAPGNGGAGGNSGAGGSGGNGGAAGAGHDGGDDGPPPEVRPETKPEVGPPPPVEGGVEVGPADAPPDVDTRDCTMKINEVQTGGATAALDEFVELYNTCPDRPFPLAGYSLVYRSDTGVTNVLLISFAAQVVPASHPFFLCANASANYTGPTPDATYPATNGLRDVGGGLALLGPNGAIVDSVGWGTATNAFVEGMPAPAPAAGQSIGRIPDGHDTGLNASDFMIATTPTPGAAN